MNIVPFQAEHIERMRIQDAQAYSLAWVDDEQARSLEGIPSFTALDGDVVLGSAGVLPIWENRALAWAYLSSDIGPYFVAIHRAVKRFLDACPYRRVEAAVDIDFAAGHRWMRMLGFRREAERMVAYRPDGGDMALYARVR